MTRLFVCTLLIVILLTPLSGAFALDKKEGPALVLKTGTVGGEGVILAGKGRLILEPEITYAHISTNKLDITGFTVLPSITIGLIQVEKIRRDIVIPSVTIKYGITDRIEVDLMVPYFYRNDEFITGVETARTKSSIDETGIGDIEGLVLLHLIREKEAIPDIVTFVKVKSDSGKDPYGLPTKTVQGIRIPLELPLGSGHWAVEPGLNFVKTVDPAILYGNVSYFWHLERDVKDLGDVDPSDSINYSLGMAYALNEKIVLSTAFENKFFSSAKINGTKQIETDITVANLLFGTTYSISEKRALSFTVSLGLTEDSSDVQMSLKMPLDVL